MKISAASFALRHRMALVLFGFALTLVGFGIIASQSSASTGTQDGKVIVGHSYKNDVSVPLRDMDIQQYVGKPMDREASALRRLRGRCCGGSRRRRCR